jgi:Asp-tRNA(Asn)/Glu-tRNA(Gln) amidotransferase A subunit family amidase
MLHELAQLVRSGEVHPRELVAESLRRIEAAAALNAVTALRAEEALAEADALDQTRRRGPLAGLPLLVKDMARTAGMRTTMGSRLYADAAPDTVDDVVVARLKAAGAIVVGRTNSPAFGHTAYTTNEVFGSTRNPWNPTRSPGGSSGGSAAALAAGLAPLATTSDGGGSVRIPASLCGLVGYKPTMGAIGRNITPRWMWFSMLGSAAARVDDVILQALVTHGPAEGDLLALPAGSVPLAPARPARIVACPSLRGGADTAIAEAFRRAVGMLGEHLGVEVTWVERVYSTNTVRDWFTIASVDLASSLVEHRDHWHEFEGSLRFLCDFGSSVSAFDYADAQRRRFVAAAELDALIGPDGVLLTPTLNAESWGPEGPLPTQAGGVLDASVATNTPEANLTGHPAVSVPMGFDGVGVPTGLQISAPRFRDDLALGVAAEWERIHHWAPVAPGHTTFGSAFGLV